ncbi:MAG: hypothetical protein WBE91_04180 [Steroidobacteraceae bacterium]
MCELVEGHERRADCAEGATPRARKSAGVTHKGLWAAIGIALLFSLFTLSVFGTYDVNQRSQPDDEELTTDFFAHEAAFDELVRMLSTDYPSLAAKGAGAIDLATIARLDTNSVRFGIYRHLLQQISVADLRYFPGSGKLILLPDGQENLEEPSESYVYLSHAQPQAFVQHHGYYWRGPGVDILTGDLPLRAGWFIRHDMTIEVAVTPY